MNEYSRLLIERAAYVQLVIAVQPEERTRDVRSLGRARAAEQIAGYIREVDRNPGRVSCLRQRGVDDRQRLGELIRSVEILLCAAAVTLKG